MRKASKKKEKKNKKARIPFKRSVSNILFALRQVWEVSPSYFVFYYFVTFIYAPLDFLTGAYLIRVIVDGLEKGTPTGSIVTYMAIVGGAAILINALSSYYWNVVSPAQYEKIGAAINKKIFKKSAEVELSCYETPEFYDKYVKAMDEAYNRVQNVMGTIDSIIWGSISLFCNSFLLFAIDPWLILFGLFPLVLGFTRKWENKLKYGHRADRKPIERRVKYVRRTFYLNDYAKEMRIGGMHARMLDELMSTFRDFKRVSAKFGLKRGLVQYIQKVGLKVVTVLGAMMYAVWRTLSDGSMSIGDCIVVLNSIETISYCINDMVATLTEFGEHSLFIEDVRYFLDYEPEMKEDENAPTAHGGDIVLENVSFRYKGADKDALSDISLYIKEGERIALVGHNGSGKTTLVKLLLRLYDPTSGSVKLAGRDAREYRLSSYRNNFSCVFQDFKMFSMSVRDNVLLRHKKDGDDELVIKALKESGAYDKVTSLEMGIDTTVTREFDEAGVNFSVGEAQKLSLARVFAESSPCIILDEPSSALDPIAEHSMFENMMRAAKGRSVIFISHRLSSAVDADRIYLMDNGQIKEVGNHCELMALNGKYAEMFRLQAENYVAKEGG